MLKPDPNDPNYKQQMEEYAKKPWQWGPAALPPSGVAPTPSVPQKPEDKKK